MTKQTAHQPKKHKCRDCLHCQWCADIRCKSCRESRKLRQTGLRSIQR